MQQMRTVANLRPMIPGVSLSVTWFCCAKAAEWIDVLLRVKTLGDPKHIVLDGGPNHPRRGEGDLTRPSPNYFGHLL